MRQLLICTDLDRTLIPNGTQAESPGAREHFATLVARPEVTLIYVTGRHRALVESAIDNFSLPLPDYVVGDVGTTIYQVGQQRDWKSLVSWEANIAADWGGFRHADLRGMLNDIPDLRLQEYTKQNTYKLSYYVPLKCDSETLSIIIRQRLSAGSIHARLVWSVDEAAGIGLLDVLPEHASKYHALAAFMESNGFDPDNTVFCGDSGNDLEVLISPIPAVLVANSQPEIQKLAISLSEEAGFPECLYIAHGDFKGMNGNYSAGMLEGIAHYYPDTIAWMALDVSAADN